MKKFFGIILAAAVMISAFSSCAGGNTADVTVAKSIPENAEVKQFKTSDYVLSSDYNYSIGEKDMYSTLLFSKDRYIYSNSNGIYVKKDLRNGGKKISKRHPRTDWSNGAVLSNGKTVYYLIVKEGTDSSFEYEVYSVDIDGKNEKKELGGIGPATLITIYNGYLYFRNSPDTSAEKDTSIMRYKLGSKKDPELMSLDYQVNYTCFYNGRIYFSNDKFSSPESLENKKARYDVYALDLDTDEIEKAVDYSYGESIAAADSKDAAFYSRKVGEKGKICIINDENEITESKRFKAKVDPWFVDKNSEYAVMCDFNKNTREVFLKYNIKTSQHKVLSKSLKNYSCEKITSGLKPTDNVYIALSAEGKKAYSKIAVQKIQGDKAYTLKFGGKNYVDADTFWITDDKLVVEVNTKMKVYELK